MDKTGFTKDVVLKMTDKFKAIAGEDQIIDRDEFKQHFAEIFGCSTSDATALFDAADSSNDGKIELREFLSLCATLQKGTAEDKITMLFKAWDKDGSGSLEEEECRTMLYHTLTCDDDNLLEEVDRVAQLLFQNIDTDNNGYITLEEFLDHYKTDSTIIRYFGGNVMPVDDLI